MKPTKNILSRTGIQLVFFLLCVAYAVPSHGEMPQLKHPNVVIITIDCLRFDHMGIYGYPRNTTPNITTFFKGAARFNQAISQSSWTSPGIISILTGLHPSVHGMDAKGKFFDKNFFTPLKQLREEGYAILGYDTSQNYADPGWSAEIKDTPPIEVLKNNRKNKFFAWFHFREPHLPYSPPEPFKSTYFKKPYATPDEKLQVLSESIKILRNELSLTQADLPAITDLYDAEVLYQDSLLAELFEFINTSELAKNTIVILTADHGEELLEHGFIGHASTSEQATVYDEVVRIPLLIKIPGNTVTSPVEHQVQQIDIMPTLFDLMGLQPSFLYQGKSLLPLIFTGAEHPSSLAFMETNHCGWRCPANKLKDRVNAVRSETWKLIEERNASETRYTFYDLAQDKGETLNLYGKVDTQKYLNILSEHQSENLRLAQSRALMAGEQHLNSARQYFQEKQFDASRNEAQQTLHLNEIYRNESPSFIEEPGTPWKTLVQETQELIKILDIVDKKP